MSTLAGNWSRLNVPHDTGEWVVEHNQNILDTRTKKPVLKIDLRVLEQVLQLHSEEEEQVVGLGQGELGCDGGQIIVDLGWILRLLVRPDLDY